MAAFTEEPYQAFRTGLTETVLHQINALNTELISVKMQLKYIEKYKNADAFVSLSDLDKHNLITFLTPIVYMKPQSFVKLFDGSKQKQLVEIVAQIKEKAVKILG